VNVAFGDVEPLHLVDAPVFDGSTWFRASTPFGNGEPNLRALYQIRGHMIDAHQIDSNLQVILERAGVGAFDFFVADR